MADEVDILLLEDSSSNNVLHYAAAYGWLPCVEYLLREAPALAAEENDWNCTPATF